jgi:hypothetical protein
LIAVGAVGIFGHFLYQAGNQMILNSHN